MWKSMHSIIISFLMMNALTGCGFQTQGNTSTGATNENGTMITNTRSRYQIMAQDTKNQGMSSYLESRLKQAGIEGSKILVLGDLIIIGRTSNKTNQYLGPRTPSHFNPTTGISGMTSANRNDTSYSYNGIVGNTGAPGYTDRNMYATNGMSDRMVIHHLFGGKGQQRVYTVWDQEAVKAIDRVNTKVRNNRVQPDDIAKDISLILSQIQLENTP